MKEHEARRVILKRKDLTDGDKVVMMAILITMDWDQWENRTSFKAISNLTGKARSSVSRNIKRLEKLGLITRNFMTAESCKAPVMTINKDHLKCSPDDNRLQVEGVNEMLTGCIQDVNRGVDEMLTGGVNRSLTDGVNRSLTLSTNSHEEPLYKSHINPWGVPSAHLWGDELREQNERVLREKKEADK